MGRMRRWEMVKVKDWPCFAWGEGRHVTVEDAPRKQTVPQNLFSVCYAECALTGEMTV